MCLAYGVFKFRQTGEEERRRGRGAAAAALRPSTSSLATATAPKEARTRCVVVVVDSVVVASAVLFNIAAAMPNAVAVAVIAVDVYVMAPRSRMPSSPVAVPPLAKSSASAMAIVLRAAMHVHAYTLSDDPPVHERPTTRHPICPCVRGVGVVVVVRVRITIIVTVVNVARRLLVHLPCIDADISTSAGTVGVAISTGTTAHVAV